MSGPPDGMRERLDRTLERADGRPWALFSDNYDHVQQMMPGAGWWAVFLDGDEIWMRQLMGWALVVTASGQQDMAGVALDGEGAPFLCNEAPNFRRYLEPLAPGAQFDKASIRRLLTDRALA